MNSNISITCLILYGLTFSEVPWKTGQFNPHGSLENDCHECHASAYWRPVKRKMSFDHSKAGFPLNGAHLSSTCRDCHKDLAFSRVSSACADCHDDVHNEKFGMECDVCHSAAKWQEQVAAHETKAHARFPLVGYHANLECARCHTGQSSDIYTKISTACNSCHMEAYQSTSNPGHQAHGFHTGCEDCHFYPISENWNRTRYAHPAGFPLEGKHRRLSCKDCHMNGYGKLSARCLNCHQKDYQESPLDHGKLNLPSECNLCHTYWEWRGARIPPGLGFVHPSSFPLTGRHGGDLNCSDCHSRGYADTPTDCFSCHDGDYGRAEPSHSGWPHDCLDCHTGNSWKGAIFEHEKYFPIRSGNHKLDCIQCHVYPNDYKRFECIQCHEHRKSKTDEEHKGKCRRYRYNSAACLDCHMGRKKK